MEQTSWILSIIGIVIIICTQKLINVLKDIDSRGQIYDEFISHKMEQIVESLAKISGQKK